MLPVFFIALSALALLGAFAAIFTSLRTAFGPDDDGYVGDLELGDRTALLDEKRSLLRALKDLEYEHAVGKISHEDFQRLDRVTRARTKKVMEALDRDLAPFLAAAEALLPGAGATSTEAKESPAKREESPSKSEESPAKSKDSPAKSKESPAKHKENPAKSKKGAAKGDTATSEAATDAAKPEAAKPEAASITKRRCASCETENDADATFCKRCAARLVAEEVAS